MRAVGVVAAFVLAAAGVARAQDNAFTQGRMEIGESTVDFLLEAREPLEAATVHTDPGFVRVRFARMTGWTHLDIEGDGGAVRFARVRPGAEDSGVLVIRLADMRRLPEHAVSVTIDGTRARVALTRAALAPVRVPAGPPPVEAAAAEPIATATAPAPVSPPATSPAADPPNPPTAPRSSAAAPTVEESAAPEPRAEDGDRSARAHTTLGAEAEPSASSVPLLLAITALLAMLYGVVRFVQRRLTPASAKSAIRVIASHRLGARQQLVVVRALGQDHFLCVDGARTERLLSVPADDGEPDPAPSSLLAAIGIRAPAGRNDAGAMGTAAAGSVAAQQFGAHLLKIAGRAAAEKTEKTRPSSVGGSVQGLIELRAKAGR